LQEQYEYDAFGWPYFYTATGESAKVNGKPGSPSGNRFLFTGREFLSGLRIYDYRNRIYQPELARFLQPDPKEFEAGDYNLYRYCHNDPVNKSDPTGLAERILEDRQWKSACFNDSGNSFQGSWAEFNDRSQAGTNGAGGSDGDGSKSYSNMKDFHLPMPMKEFIAWTRGVEGGDPMDTRPLIDPIDIASGGVAAIARGATKSLAASEAMTVFRVWGGEAGAMRPS